ncbi:hypothetical protein BGY98DRAFT_943602 [Russula aff. rugulosa BPL654]|nr:hypothetical protein BGY98DRAFT_943602 [Russula aff. rugulosa BPL654]
MNSLKPTKPTTNTGKDSPKTSIRPTKTNVAEMPPRPDLRAEASTRLVLPPTRTRAASSAWLPHPLLQPSHCRVPRVSPVPL